MSYIHVLDEPTINQIAAGEVVERPSAVVKELIENAMDAGATAITAEIKEGGLSFIRITDNGAGIAKEDIPLAFLRHATSKIRSAEDLLSVTSLGFRGEALSSIAAVAQVELITKTPSALNGFRYLIDGGEEKSIEEIGCPGGTTILVRNLFFNTPARRKFLKSATTEAGYISDLMERLMVSHPNVSFKFIMNNQVKLQSSGNNNSKDILYHVYGRDISKELLPLDFSSEEIKITGFIGKPLITRGNRNFENYFINGRYIKSSIISKAIEEAYKPFLMQHKYPFTSIYFEINPALIDVNVHPQKLEIRLKNGEDVYQNTFNAIRNALSGKEMIPQIALTKQEELKPATVRMPEPFEQNRRKQFENLGINSGLNVRTNAGVNQGMNTGIIPGMNSRINVGTNSETNARTNSETNAGTNSELSSIGTTDSKNTSNSVFIPSKVNSLFDSNSVVIQANNNIVYGENSTELLINKVAEQSSIYPNASETPGSKNISNLVPNDNSDLPEQVLQSPESINQPQSIVDNGNNLNSTTLDQMNLFTSSEAETQAPFLSKKALEEHRIIGQIFSTYWLVEYKKELYIIDQHAAHEKVLYERIMNAAFEKTFESQQLLPPIVLTLTLREQEVLHKHEEILNSIGYEFEHFGGNEYSVRAVPADLYSISEKELLLEFIDDLTEDFVGVTPNATSILERVASLSCKAAVKANHNFSNEEAYALIKELLTLENPYHCPHGRPVIVSMSQYELERKFKRIL
ncbi:MAG: mutL [Herbinix sp.]|jgi:DNA mismatch repair protein MutL|nr:mutL [Herbinix sp.]